MPALDMDLLAARAACTPRAALAMAAAITAPLVAALPGPACESLLASLPPPLRRSVLLQLPTTSAYTEPKAYVAQVANQMGVRTEPAIVAIALFMALFAPCLPAAAVAALGPSFQSFLPAYSRLSAA